MPVSGSVSVSVSVSVLLCVCADKLGSSVFAVLRCVCESVCACFLLTSPTAEYSLYCRGVCEREYTCVCGCVCSCVCMC